MNLQRGDVLKARFPHASGGRGKKRPVVVVQADDYNQRLHHAVVAQVTSNLDEKDDPAYLFVKAATPEGKAAGLDRDCLICCTLLSLMTEDRLRDEVGNPESICGHRAYSEGWRPTVGHSCGDPSGARGPAHNKRAIRAQEEVGPGKD